MRAYLDLLQRILDEGTWSENRTGVRSLGIYGHMLRFELADGFPLVTTKSVHFRSVVTELLFFIRGYTDARWLQDRKCRIWNEWATAEQCAARGLAEFDLGPIYGWQWRHFGATYRGMAGEREDSVDYRGEGFDQLLWAQEQLRRDPASRQIVINAWSAVDRPKQALPPCHVLIQFRVIRGRLHCAMYQRSADAFLGVPFNIASYALLTHMMAQSCDLLPGAFVHFLADAHLYENHLEQVRTQLGREPRPLPRLELDPSIRDVTAFEAEHIRVAGYDPHAALRGEVAV